MVGTGTFDSPKWKVCKVFDRWHVLQPFSWQLGVINGFGVMQDFEDFDTWGDAMDYATTHKPELQVLS
ncbi:hypothetical protein NJBCHELONAE_48800 [Mycobacteroides chelonae]|uniref:hypothetical protein n=1 Tax=Mycobacteroides chelonae TaxID=1774 RepID=UPI0021DDF2CC|nr:hypothetical protein [Mycobacteroides chelonae]GLE59567.1 hypothetical protein NJBCHELONAE_48800 [Mycobacteroides chelonae]